MKQREDNTVISIRSLSKSYAGPEGKTIIHALSGCSLDIAEGSFTVFAGKSGCGKTTLLKLIAGLEQPDSGAVEFSTGQDGATVPKLGFMFQDLRLLPWLSVEQNLALAFPPPKGKAEKAAVRNEITRVLALTGLAGRAASLPRELSGGMAQRAALARCLCRNPAILLLDEPLSSLDAVTRLHLRNELEKLRQRPGLTVILVTHDIEEAVFFGDRIFLMNEGKPDAEVPIPLKRPRNYRSAEFQEYCRKIEDTLILQAAPTVQ
ncbi:MAG: ABC transporter ATP-binding protein [Spirochaetaceae bacterium]|jgi:ABC-type nitrate/sulfonate/bicarbonate transport system ATPase subunit|nr:ABC transporter ATP-binding protein [Spirochaetaceae bacterium]